MTMSRTTKSCPHKARRRALPRITGTAMLVAGLLAACGSPPPKPQPVTPPPPVAAAPAVPEIAAIPIDRSAYAPPPPRRPDAVVVGLLLPTGDARPPIRDLAGHLYNAAQLALFDAGNPNLVLRLHDTGGTPEGAGTAVRAALSADVDLLVGPLFGQSAKAVAPLLRGRDVPALAFSNDSSAADDAVWLMGFLPEQNISRIAAEAVAQGLTRFGALLPEGPYGSRIGDVFEAEVARFGGTVVRTERYPPDAQGMFEPVKRLADFDRRTAAHKEEMDRLVAEGLALAPQLLDEETLSRTDLSEPDALFRALARAAPELVSAYETLKLTETLGDIPYDAVFMPEGGLALRNLAPLLPYFDIDPKRVKFFGTALWDDPTLAQEPPLHGGWYAAPDSRNWAAFAGRYERVYRSKPPRLAALAYDAVSLAARLAAIQPDAPFGTDALTNINGFAGIDGIVRLRPGGLNERGLAVQEVTAQLPRTVSRASVSFVDYDRRLRSALALADSLKRQNPDLALPQAARPAADAGAAAPLQVNPGQPDDDAEAVEPSALNPAAIQPAAGR